MLHAGTCRVVAAALLVPLGEAAGEASIGPGCGCVGENWRNIPPSAAAPLCHVAVPLPVH